MPSRLSTFDESPKNLARCATISEAMASKSLIFLARRPESNDFKPSMNLSRCSPLNSSGDPSFVRTASSDKTKVSKGDERDTQG